MTVSPAWRADPLRELNLDARCEAAESQELDAFDEYRYKWETPSPAGEPARLTIRFETVPSRWRTVRWWAGLLIVLAATAAGGRLVSSRRSSARHHPRRVERKATARNVPRVEPRAPHRRPRPIVAHPARGKHPRHGTRRRRRRTAFTRRRFVPSVSTSPPPGESPQAVLHAQARREAPASQFSYLGK
jgi:hypothetical protein